MTQRIVVVDLETAGTNPRKHPITQIALVACALPSWEILETFEQKVHFNEADADPEALAVSSYDPEAWHRDGVLSSTAMKRVSEFFKRHATLEKVSKRTGNPYWIARLCAHKAAFDCEGFLAEWYKSVDEFCPAGCYEALCTMSLARWAGLALPVPLADSKLSTICEALGIEVDGQAHEALHDALAVVELAKTLCIATGLRLCSSSVTEARR